MTVPIILLWCQLLWLLLRLSRETLAFSDASWSSATRSRRKCFFNDAATTTRRSFADERHRRRLCRRESVPQITFVRQGDTSSDDDSAVSHSPFSAVFKDVDNARVQLQSPRQQAEEEKSSSPSSLSSSPSSSLVAQARVPNIAEAITTTLALDRTTIATTSNVQQEQQQQQTKKRKKKKNTILFLLWTIALLSSLDRVAMSVAIVPIATEYYPLWTDSMKGTVSSFFSLGYGLGIVPAGLVLANSSPKIVMALGMIIWSVATIFTPLGVDATTTTVASAAGSVWLLLPLCVMRMAVGLGESIVIPSVQRTLSIWTDESEKSRALAFIFSGFASGTILAYLASPILIASLGSWRSLFHVYGAIGLLLVVPWWLLAQDSPTTTMTTDNKVHDPMPQRDLSLLTNAPWRDFAQSPGVWGMLLAHAAKNWGLYNNLAWTPTFYAEQYGLTVANSAWLSVLPSIAGVVGSGVAGVAADAWLISSSPSTTTTIKRSVEEITRLRKVVQGIAFLGPAAALATLAYDIPEKAITAQWFLMITVGLQSFNSAGFEAGNQEKAGPKWSGLLYSVTSLPAVFFGTLGVWATGRILDATDQDWSVVFAINAAVNVCGALAFFKLFDSKKEFE